MSAFAASGITSIDPFALDTAPQGLHRPFGLVREIRLSRALRLRLLLLSGAAFIATVVPLTLAATDALSGLGASAGGTSAPTLALIACLGVAAPLASIRLSTLKIMALGIAAAAGLTLAAQGSADTDAMLSLAYPAVALALSLLGMLAARHVVIEFEHEYQRLQCSRFVPEQVVDQLLARPDAQIVLGGVDVQGTIVFVDLRGFTTFSEARAPGEVIAVLNHYLSEISCAMLDHGGTVVSYLGDGLMAIFGAPLEQDDHADRALAAAREIIEIRLPRANEWMQMRGLGDGFRLGIGVNSGSFVAGNVGNHRRLEYTAIGDAANTAARIQELTKHAGRMLLVDGSTCAGLCREAPDLVPLGEYDVRGRQGKVELWSLACDAPAEPTAA
ncbi:MAG TPA: adenylate/guanylate cyclase domain-containing protein [Gaiellaceae bacterium]